MMEFPQYVYILRCADGGPYTGCTNNLDDRIVRHGKGMVVSTMDRMPVECTAAFGFSDKYKAYAFEKYLKSGSGRAFMKHHLI